MIEVIDNRRSEHAALLASKGERRESRAHPTPEFFEIEVKKYFPEFGGFRHLREAYPAHYWYWLYVDEAGRVHNDREMLSWVSVAHQRSAIYEAEYRHLSPAVLGDVWEALSFGAPRPDDEAEATRRARELAGIWEERLAQGRETDARACRGWSGLLADYKTGKDDSMFAVARAAGIDAAVAERLAEGAKVAAA